MRPICEGSIAVNLLTEAKQVDPGVRLGARLYSLADLIRPVISSQRLAPVPIAMLLEESRR